MQTAQRTNSPVHSLRRPQLPRRAHVPGPLDARRFAEEAAAAALLYFGGVHKAVVFPYAPGGVLAPWLLLYSETDVLSYEDQETFGELLAELVCRCAAEHAPALPKRIVCSRRRDGQPELPHAEIIRVLAAAAEVSEPEMLARMHCPQAGTHSRPEGYSASEMMRSIIHARGSLAPELGEPMCEAYFEHERDDEPRAAVAMRA